MSNHVTDRLKALILILMAVFLAEKFFSGRLYYYIGPRFSWLTILAIGLFITMAGAYNLISAPDDIPTHEHVHAKTKLWQLLIVALPLFLGVIIPASPLGASAISNRGVSTTLSLTADGGASTLTVIPGERNVLDWVRAMNANPDPAALNGQEADVVGFVYRDTRFSDDQFMVARFTITCCVADAMAIGVVVVSQDASKFASDSWVRVKGTFTEGMLDSETIPVLVADEIVAVQPPEQPYLYP